MGLYDRFAVGASSIRRIFCARIVVGVVGRRWLGNGAGDRVGVRSTAGCSRYGEAQKEQTETNE